MEKQTFIQMFNGIDGFRLGLERTGWKCVWSNDNDPKSCQVSRYHYDDGTLCEQDVRRVDERQIPDHTLLTGGFPCQSFSYAGHRKGFEDSRGTLFFDIARVVKAKRPELLLFENVRGLLSAPALVGTGFHTATEGDGKREITGDLRRVQNESGRGWKEIKIPVCQGYCFAEILRVLEDLGYEVAEWQVLNSKHFGVPQNRPRVFIVGHLRGGRSRQIFPFFQTDRGVDETRGEAQSEETRVRIAGALRKNIPNGGTDTFIGIANSITRRYGKDGKENLIGTVTSRLNKDYGRDLIQVGTNPNNQTDRVYSEKGISPTLNANTGGRHVPSILPDVACTIDCDGYLRNGARPRDEEGKPQLLPIGYRRIRRLTPVECERLQGFPDGWTKFGKTVDGKITEMSDSARYKMLGNAVTVNVIEFLGKLLKGSIS